MARLCLEHGEVDRDLARSSLSNGHRSPASATTSTGSTPN